jgi:hypothetical protein
MGQRQGSFRQPVVVCVVDPFAAFRLPVLSRTNKRHPVLTPEVAEMIPKHWEEGLIVAVVERGREDVVRVVVV